MQNGISAPPRLAPVRAIPKAKPKFFEKCGASVALIPAAPIAGYANPISA